MASLPAEIHGVRPNGRRPGLEILLVILISAAVLTPGISTYSLVDPWETHYGEVSRAMLQDNDFVHTNWPGTSSGAPGDLEGFRSKPVLMFWMMAAGLRAVGVADHGGYSGELVASPRTMIGIRFPFIVSAIFGLVLMWWMLAKLVDRRLAWLALLVVGSMPMFCLIARQAIPDMPMCACTMGSIALFILAVEDGERPCRSISFGRGKLPFDARHIVLGISIGFIALQAIYYAIYFISSPQLGVHARMPTPALWLPLVMLWIASAMSRDGWLLCLWRLPCVLIGGIIAAIVDEPMPHARPGQSTWRHIVDDILVPWERHSLDRYAVRVLPVALAVITVLLNLIMPMPGLLNAILLLAIVATSLIWGTVIAAAGWAGTDELADHLLRMKPITTMRQVYLLACYFLLGISILAKGPPGVVVVALVAVFQVICFHRWSALYEGAYELKRCILLVFVVAIPWHFGMFLKEGPRYVDEYWYTHILNRAGTGVDNSVGTFEYYANQIGHGMYLWAALLPAALAALFVHANRATREGRVRFLVGLWAILGVALFCVVQTKFHHYILPALPGLGIVVAFFLRDMLARRERLHLVYALLGVGIVLLMTRDLMFEPERWIEMFVFRYDRPWPSAEPYVVDTSDPILALGLGCAVALLLAATRFVRIGVGALATMGLLVCIWSLQIYMPIAGQHWGMRDAIRTYYDQRTVYGEKLVYFGEGELADDWTNSGRSTDQRAGERAGELGGASDIYTIETFVPAGFQLGQPMTITIQINKAEDERITEQELVLVGKATAVRDHEIDVSLLPGERARLQPIIARGQQSGKRGRAPVRAVDADRLIAWQLYWRGEQFWSGGEIWGYLPEMKTSFVNTNNVEFNKYINDRTRMPIGRRYFVVTEAGRITSIRPMLPTPRARDTFEVLDTTSNKFSLAAFTL